MRIVSIHAAEANLSRLIDLACAGEEIVIGRNDGPVVKLVPVRTSAGRRQRGSLEGEVVVPDAFFDPLPAHVLDRWEQ
ncbi:type II toxin-antitoxin system Phd/YefM family antitoxin [Longimicrobium sp.]|jgi:antitoxin (DNA-binding transcriptional repressor) of toxin-antitoxin stability system|uniref:type II toxin-antitoxin system Phd/YefM family antitoxin n=1 Tax=Longimicrobium sp. TaxID=2029185 RepID=UPI002EDA0297